MHFIFKIENKYCTYISNSSHIFMSTHIHPNNTRAPRTTIHVFILHFRFGFSFQMMKNTIKKLLIVEMEMELKWKESCKFNGNLWTDHIFRVNFAKWIGNFLVLSLSPSLLSVSQHLTFKIEMNLFLLNTNVTFLHFSVGATFIFCFFSNEMNIINDRFVCCAVLISDVYWCKIQKKKKNGKFRRIVTGKSVKSTNRIAENYCFVTKIQIIILSAVFSQFFLHLRWLIGFV